MAETRDRSVIIDCTTAADSPYVLYTCPANCRAKVPLVFITNANGTNTITFKWYRASLDTSYFIIGGKNTSLGEFIQLSDGYIVLEPNDRLEVTIGSNGVVDAICTVEETFLSNQTR